MGKAETIIGCAVLIYDQIRLVTLMRLRFSFFFFFLKVSIESDSINTIDIMNEGIIHFITFTRFMFH